MDMQGQRPLPVAQDHVWAALNNPEILKACIPGCEKFEASDDNSYSVGTALKIGPVSARFAGKVHLSDIVAPESYKLSFDAQGGVAGFGKGESVVRLCPTDTGCELHYTVNATVGGKLAQLGQRLIDGVAKNLADDFFKRFEAELLKRHPQSEATPAAVPEPESAAGLPAWALWGLGAVGLIGAIIWFSR